MARYEYDGIGGQSPIYKNLKAWITGSPGSRVLQFYVNDTLRLTTSTIGDTWDGGAVGLYSLGGATTTIQWDNFLCGIDANENGGLGTAAQPEAEDYIYAACTFDGAGWSTLAFTHDDAGNLTFDTASAAKRPGPRGGPRASLGSLRQGLTGDELFKPQGLPARGSTGWRPEFTSTASPRKRPGAGNM